MMHGIVGSDNVTKAWMAKEKHGELVYEDFSLSPLKDDQVEIQVTHNGLCHTDVVMADNEWGVSKFPLVPGHEVVGVVARCGPAVKGLKEGDRVGVGWIKGSCGKCEYCEEDRENICLNNYDGLIVGVGPFASEDPCGGYARSIRVNEKFAFLIPEGMKSEEAAPLLCAGSTVYSPLKRYLTKPGMKVGVVGIGGLGHLALKMALAMGADVYAISSSDKKKELVKQCGVPEENYINASDPAQVEKAKLTLDLVLNTVPCAMEYQPSLDMCRQNATYCMLGIPPINLPVFVPQMVFWQLHVVGSIVVGSQDMREMFTFCLKHNILPEVQVASMKEINRCFKEVRDNKIPFRYVLTFD
eukprot:Nk52_evm102s208 gene=Nk52_evmTU102s208